MTKYERAVFGVLELVDAEIITFSRAAEILGIKILPLREYNRRRPKKSVIQSEREAIMERVLKQNPE